MQVTGRVLDFVQAFLHGSLLALGLILPLGIQNLFVFNQGAAQPSLWRALPVVIAAAACDTLLIVLSVQGVSLLLLTFGFFKIIVVAAGVVFLCYMGWLTWHNTTVQQNDNAESALSIRQQVFFAASVSLLNPHAILDTIGVIGTSSVAYQGKEKLLFTVACILVSWVWFFFLAALGRKLGSQQWFTRGFAVVNKASAIFMWGSALYMVYTTL